MRACILRYTHADKNRISLEKIAFKCDKKSLERSFLFICFPRFDVTLNDNVGIINDLKNWDMCVTSAGSFVDSVRIKC